MNISQKNIVLNVFFNMNNLDINEYSLAKDRLKLCACRKTLGRFRTRENDLEKLICYLLPFKHLYHVEKNSSLRQVCF
jgi:hypothetical protein